MRNLFIFLAFAIYATNANDGVQMTCSFERKSTSYSGTIRFCTVSEIYITEPNVTITSINGKSFNDTNRFFNDNQGNYFKIDEVGGITFESKTVNYVPKGLEKFFPDLKVLRIRSSSLKEVHKSDLDQFPRLEEVDLYYNVIEVLDANLFHGNRELKYIYLEYNQKLMYVGSGIFSSLHKLQNVNMNNCGCVSVYSNYNSMDYVKNQVAASCPSLESMKAKFCKKDVDNLMQDNADLKQNIESLENEIYLLKSRMNSLLASCNANLDSATKNLLIASKKSDKSEAISSRSHQDEKDHQMNITVECYQSVCHASKFEVKFPSTIISEVTGQQSGNSQDDFEPTPAGNISESLDVDNITELVISEQASLFLPLNIGEKFPNLSSLIVSASGLYKIDAKIFENLGGLTTLVLSSNKIIEIPVGTFVDLPNLETLDLSNNNIENLETGVFKNLENLKTLNLNHNKLVTVNTEAFQNLKNLEKLNLKQNQLKFVSANLLSTLQNLQEVDFTGNQCLDMTIPIDTKETVETAIIDNCIAPINLVCSTTWSIDSSAESPNDSTCEASNLKVDYPKTKISGITGKTDEVVTKTTTLKISGQSTKYLPYQLSANFLKLEIIVVVNSKLTSLQKDDFTGLTNLRNIDIRHNNITLIEPGTFDGVNQLEHLDLSSNHIQSLPLKIFAELVNLKTLILSENSIARLSADFLPRKNSIETFKVDKNELEIIETKILRFLRKANVIDLSDNVCIDLKYDKTNGGSKRLVELSGEIDLNCSSDD